MNRSLHTLKRLLHHESAPGVLLVIAMLLAMTMENSPLSAIYRDILHTKAGVVLGPLALQKPIMLWINDGLMAIFFLLVGLEVKREILEGHLSRFADIALPGIAALGGMVVPALIYFTLNRNDAVALRGWAIPTATDIAFALGILSLFGSRVPGPLKIFLLTLAIIDDLGAIVIIATFYSTDISTVSLLGASIAVAALIVLNRLRVQRKLPYVLFGMVMWVFLVKSGVHATLGGVVLAFTIPMRAPSGRSMVTELEHSLHPWVMLAIMPIFAFANAGVPFAGLSLAALMEPIPLGIACALFFGKFLGVSGFTWLSLKLGLVRLPPGVNLRHIVAVAALCGIGFTMSLFIGSLAFEGGGPEYGTAVRLGILTGTGLSTLLGLILLRGALNQEPVTARERGTVTALAA